MAEDLEREAKDAEFIAKAFGGPPAPGPVGCDPELEAFDTALHKGLPAITTPRRNKPARAFRGGGFKPGTRQPAPTPQTSTGELPWYAKVKPGESMMAAAAAEQHRMKQSKAGRALKTFVND